MKALIKIVGVQYAVNPDHEAGKPMSEEENARTIDYLTGLKEKKPRVTLLLEPTNEKDPNAVACRVSRAKSGYVSNLRLYKRRARLAINADGAGKCRGRVVDVVVGEHGFYYIEVEVPDAPVQETSVTDLRWAEWKPAVPKLAMREEWMQGECSLQVLADLAGIENPDDEDREEMQDCLAATVALLRHAPWNEIQVLAEKVLTQAERLHDELHIDMGRQIERLLCGMCSERRLEERRSSWLPSLRSSHEARQVWLQWLQMHHRTETSLTRRDLTAWLGELQEMLGGLHAIDTCTDGDELELLSRAYYSNVPREKFLLLLSVLLLSREIEERLLVVDAKQNIQSKSLRDLMVKEVLRYAESRNTEEEVNVLQSFVYRIFNYLPPEQKLLVDGMTERFKPMQPITSVTVQGDVVESGGNKTVILVES